MSEHLRQAKLVPKFKFRVLKLKHSGVRWYPVVIWQTHSVPNNLKKITSSSVLNIHFHCYCLMKQFYFRSLFTISTLQCAGAAHGGGEDFTEKLHFFVGWVFEWERKKVGKCLCEGVISNRKYEKNAVKSVKKCWFCPQISLWIRD